MELAEGAFRLLSHVLEPFEQQLGLQAGVDGFSAGRGLVIPHDAGPEPIPPASGFVLAAQVGVHAVADLLQFVRLVHGQLQGCLGGGQLTDAVQGADVRQGLHALPLPGDGGVAEGSVGGDPAREDGAEPFVHVGGVLRAVGELVPFLGGEHA